jgi:hypothetical protein
MHLLAHLQRSVGGARWIVGHAAKQGNQDITGNVLDAAAILAHNLCQQVETVLHDALTMLRVTVLRHELDDKARNQPGVAGLFVLLGSLLGLGKLFAQRNEGGVNNRITEDGALSLKSSNCLLQ